MIKESVIERIKSSVSIADVIGGVIELKKNGPHKYIGCCPFHNEKTPSFNVDEQKGFYKCFGCGKSGDAIKFVQEYKRLDFVSSIESLAKQTNITVEFENDYSPTERIEQQAHKKEIERALKFTHALYHKKLMDAPRDSAVWQFIFNRGITEETVKEWQMGWATDTWNELSGQLIDVGLQRIGIELGLLKETEQRTYDKYRNRLIIPSVDRFGQINGFVGRTLSADGKEAKYINPAASDVYFKTKEVFGLYQALPAIKEEEMLFLVEGNIDVVMMAQAGIKNVAAPGGTALTTEQCKVIKKYTDTVCIMTDGDSAGQLAAGKWLRELLKQSFKVQIIELPMGEDPDSYIQSLIKNQTND